MKHIYIVDEHQSSKQNGVGTYICQLLKCFEGNEYDVNLISFNSDEAEFKVEQRPFYTEYQAKAVGERNEVECSFGTGKRVYRANNIRAKLPDTARCWTGMCYFVKNVMRFLRELCHALIEIWHYLKLIASPVGLIRNPLVTARY